MLSSFSILYKTHNFNLFSCLYQASKGFQILLTYFAKVSLVHVLNIRPVLFSDLIVMSSEVIKEAEEIGIENVKRKKPNVIIKKQTLEPSCNHVSKEIPVSKTNKKSIQKCPRSKKMKITNTKTEPKVKSNHDDVINPELSRAKQGHSYSKASFIRLSNIKELVRKAVRTENCRVMVSAFPRRRWSSCALARSGSTRYSFSHMVNREGQQRRKDNMCMMDKQKGYLM